MANESVAQPQLTELSLNDPSLEEDQFINPWLKSNLPPGIAFRMARVEEAIDGLSGVSKILLRDLAHEEDSQAHGDIKYTPLNANVRSKLASAIRGLTAAAANDLEDARRWLEKNGSREH